MFATRVIVISEVIIVVIGAHAQRRCAQFTHTGQQELIEKQLFAQRLQNEDQVLRMHEK